MLLSTMHHNIIYSYRGQLATCSEVQSKNWSSLVATCHDELHEAIAFTHSVTRCPSNLEQFAADNKKFC
jgi:hypothetical protein